MPATINCISVRFLLFLVRFSFCCWPFLAKEFDIRGCCQLLLFVSHCLACFERVLFYNRVVSDERYGLCYEARSLDLSSFFSSLLGGILNLTVFVGIRQEEVSRLRAYYCTLCAVRWKTEVNRKHLLFWIAV
jgi:hypothetical protein